MHAGWSTDSATKCLAARRSISTVYAIYTGVVPIVYKAQRALLDNLMQSSFWSFVTITPLHDVGLPQRCRRVRW